MAKRTNQQAGELAAMNDAQLLSELEGTYRQLFTLRLQVATRQLQNVKEISRAKRKVARIKTLQRQRELVAAGGGR